MNNLDADKPKRGYADNFGLIYAAVCCLAACFTPLMRSGFGCEGLGFSAFFAMLILLVYASASDGAAMWVYFVLWLLMLVYRRAETLRLELRGVDLHSRSCGRSYLTAWLLRNDKLAAAWGDPILCVMVGLPLAALSPQLGAFIAWGGGLSLMVKGRIEVHVYRMRVRRMKDARLENVQLISELRR